MPADTEQDIVARLPQVGELASSDLLLLATPVDRDVLANLLERAKAFIEHPQDAISRFSNSPSVEPG